MRGIWLKTRLTIVELQSIDLKHGTIKTILEQEIQEILFQ